MSWFIRRSPDRIEDATAAMAAAMAAAAEVATAQRAAAARATAPRVVGRRPRRCDPTSDTVSRLNETDWTKERELAAERKRISGEGRRRTKGCDDEGKKSDP